jgi:hypothetical protein
MQLIHGRSRRAIRMQFTERSRSNLRKSWKPRPPPRQYI